MERRAPRVVHFVTGGFSGATQVAVDLCRAHVASGRFEPRLVLRRKRQTDLSRVQALRDEGLQVDLVPGWSHLATLWSLWRLLRRGQPALMVAHGFPEHLLGRWAARLAGVTVRVQVEHNSRERYTAFRRWQARRLMASTAAFVGVSEGVRDGLLAFGTPAARTLAIPNGIDLRAFQAHPSVPADRRQPQIVMSARFARQKDHLNLIEALAQLRDRHHCKPVLMLAGGGSASHRHAVEQRVAQRGLQDQVRFLGHVAGLPALLGDTRLFVLSTRWEGMPLALVEAMAAGCACIATDVPGVRGVFDDGREGLLVPAGDPAALADAMATLLTQDARAAALGEAARAHALAAYDLRLMRSRYEALFVKLGEDAARSLGP